MRNIAFSLMVIFFASVSIAEAGTGKVIAASIWAWHQPSAVEKAAAPLAPAHVAPSREPIAIESKVGAILTTTTGERIEYSNGAYRFVQPTTAVLPTTSTPSQQPSMFFSGQMNCANGMCQPTTQRITRKR